MNKIQSEELLKIPEVVEEIKKHLWIESEKKGHDIGFERACRDWLKCYSRGWMQYHMPATIDEKKSVKARKITK